MVSLAAIEDAVLQLALKEKWIAAKEGPSVAVCAQEKNRGKTKILLFTQYLTSADEVNKSLQSQGFSD